MYKIINYKKKLYRQNNKEKLKLKDHNKYIKNKDVRIQQAKDYYLNNIHNINQRRKIKITCDCGSEIVKCTKARHEQTTKHKTFLQNNSTVEADTHLICSDIDIQE